MNIGFIGLGKLGLPCALAIESRGHIVVGMDKSSSVRESIESKTLAYREEGAEELLKSSKIKLLSTEEVVRQSSIIFIAVQTPHSPMYEGVTRLPSVRMDFDYTFLVEAVREVNEAVVKVGAPKTIVVVSTVLPGTMNRLIIPGLSPLSRFCYNPFFIAMGTCIPDFLNPEFVLLGADSLGAGWAVSDFYATITKAPVRRMSITEAELTKVVYNTFISQKIVFANTVMEIAHKTGCNSDVVLDALGAATNRIISTKYLKAGMGDGGGCHPRDCIAMSYLSRSLGLHHDVFDDLMQARYGHTEWLADMIQSASEAIGLPVVVLGRSFKKESNITTGSPARLLIDILSDRGIRALSYDPFIDGEMPLFAKSVYFIATAHQQFRQFDYVPGSVVLDPWGIVPDENSKITVVRLGRK